MANKPVSAIINQQPPPFNLSLSDDALVTFGAPVGPGAVSFLDVGYMPVNELTIAGDPLQLKGKLDGLFIQYSGTGVQHFAANGAPTTADFTSLHYDIVGYKGDATFDHAADGSPRISDAKHLTVLAQGDLIMGQLAFNAGGGITGKLDASLRIDGHVVGTLAISVQHPAGDIGPAMNGLTLTGGTLNATFTPLPMG